jgi:hypothetical protein
MYDSITSIYETLYGFYKKYNFLVIVVALVVSFVFMCSVSPSKPNIEGLVNGAGGVSLGSLDGEVQTNNRSLKSVDLDLDVHEETYKSIVTNMKDNINLTMLREIVKYSDVISRNPVSEDALKAIAEINSLKQFGDSLDKTGVFLEID